ncbi:hypothetical protein FGB62_40g143 [Gracilaria domingensis]|nr:hypothetical protein FGB62_40g143 [Gracilaria domingensis]
MTEAQSFSEGQTASIDRPSTSFFSDRSSPSSRKTTTRRSAFFRTLSSRKAVSTPTENADRKSTGPRFSRTSRINSSAAPWSRGKSRPPFERSMSRTKSLCEKIAGSKPEPVFGSRADTGRGCISAKQAILAKYPGLAIQQCDDGATKLVVHGLNSLRAETLDLHSMVYVMHDYRQKLTHRAVERFFQWIPLFVLYVERYMLVDEHVILRWVESSGGLLRGSLRQSVRMKARGSIQHQLSCIERLRSSFTPSLPAGERFGNVRTQCELFTGEVEKFCNLIQNELIPIVKERFSESELHKAKLRVVRHVVQFVGYQDFLAIYTRWMRHADLLEWKSTILLPCDFKFFAYGTWDKDMDVAHYQIAAKFEEFIQEENRADEEAEKQTKADFERARASRQTENPLGDLDGVEVEMAEEEYVEDGEED